jgi:hypothetical protein
MTTLDSLKSMPSETIPPQIQTIISMIPGKWGVFDAQFVCNWGV